MDLAPYPGFHQLPGLSGVGKAHSLPQSSLTISKFTNGQALRPHIATKRSHDTTGDIAWSTVATIDFQLSPPYLSNSRPLTTTQRPRPSHSPPPQNIQTSPWGEPASASSTHIELPPIASSYPPFTNPDSRPSQSHSVSLQSTVQASTPHRAFRNTTASTNATTGTTATAAPRELSSTNCILHPFGPERTTTQLSSASNSTGKSQASLLVFDSLEENDFFFGSPASSFSEAMPPAIRRSTTAADARAGSAHASKRRRTSTTAAPAAPPRPTSTQRKSPATGKDMDVEELFGTSHTCSPIDVEPKAEFDTIDLTENNEVFEEVRKPEKDNRVKLAAFQCVICMDDCSNLTVTHCGHLYCASCLHQSLHVDVTKVKCPMCRQKLDMKPRKSYDSTTKGYWLLELKLMTATRKGKRKAYTLS
ncbi:hypothetical protein QL093DRAFT_2542000 [Fusarium oxysporum]|nr:hypothetical protein QL093DRAFT_2542000 [Fusarium oxysporum]